MERGSGRQSSGLEDAERGSGPSSKGGLEDGEGEWSAVLD